MRNLEHPRDLATTISSGIVGLRLALSNLEQPDVRTPSQSLRFGIYAHQLVSAVHARLVACSRIFDSLPPGRPATARLLARARHSSRPNSWRFVSTTRSAGSEAATIERSSF